ncbi:MAG: hypothetical protein ACEQSK_20795 [Sphingomonadaceae bacterium]
MRYLSLFCGLLAVSAHAAHAANVCPSNERTVALSQLPPDASYEQLTAAQKAIVRADYDNLPAADEPPYPLAGQAAIRKELAKAQGKMRSDGPVTLLVNVDASGTARTVSVYDSPDINATKVTTFAVMTAKYKPGKCAGQPCRMDYRFDFCFDPR